LQALPGASLDYTMGIEKQAEQVLKTFESHVFDVGGSSFGSSPNSGVAFVMLKDFAERQGEEHSAKMVVRQPFGVQRDYRALSFRLTAIDQRPRHLGGTARAAGPERRTHRRIGKAASS
jgi:multidrug efflux pump subunit AcrB